MKVSDHLPVYVMYKSKIKLCSDSGFIRYCPLSTDGQVYPIPSAIAHTPPLHFA